MFIVGYYSNNKIVVRSVYKNSKSAEKYNETYDEDGNLLSVFYIFAIDSLLIKKGSILVKSGNIYTWDKKNGIHSVVDEDYLCVES